MLCRDILNPMTRRHALLLFVGGRVVAQDRPTGVQTQSQSRHTVVSPPESPVEWNPRPVFVGAPVLFKSRTYSGPATWLGRMIRLRPDGDVFSALAGVGLNQAPGSYPLILGGETAQVRVSGHAYPSSTIRVPEKFVAPPQEIQKQIEEEIAVKEWVFKSSSPDRLWQGPFVPPAATRYTSSFGARRIYNGKIRSVHQGLDYSAPMGTQVRAANSGRVVIARPMYFEGGLVVIDHGESIFTLYMHLSEFLVKERAAIDKGAPIAKSGSSGRVTGPHLHFGVRWQNLYLEPSTLFSLWNGETTRL